MTGTAAAEGAAPAITTCCLPATGFAYVLGLGLIARRGGQFQIANPIYKEVIPRVLSYAQQAQLNQSTSWYLRGPRTIHVVGC